MTTGSTHALSPQTRLRQYVIAQLLGYGAFGLVYRALDTRRDMISAHFQKISNQLSEAGSFPQWNVGLH